MTQTLYMAFIFSLGLGTTLTFVSNHWLYAWMGVEISTMAMIPLMADNYHPRSTEAMIKYFIIQSVSATMLIFATVINSAIDPQWGVHQITHPLAAVIILLALGMKVGLAPCHMWLPEILQGLKLSSGSNLSTWQKLAPFALMLQMAHIAPHNSLFAAGVLSTLMAGWAGMNQTQIRKILAYSSTAHLGWTIIVLHFIPNLSALVLGVYIFSTLTAFLTLMETSSTKISDLSQALKKSLVVMVVFSLTLLSLAGLPPLSGFLPKWLVLEEMIKQEETMLASLIAISALLSLFFYIRLCFFTIMTLFPSTTKIPLHWRNMFKKQNTTMAVVATSSVILLPFAPLISAVMLFYP
uniref:NADH-ubiquinone oxidoreductase chain 2 n=1 Tax=Petitella bleheri TaxID=3359282 RepID=A0A0K2SES0_9TELE|nr:NADH dehydrogenase subunit 2 [Hemigrammus bleheri]QIA91275.1 NADH dehydrogenase subunit 2 [Hemigrammus bleheri]BAS25613.1 NADH dehydrogenase subunit 2 [Hemigrammus bleheri]